MGDPLVASPPTRIPAALAAVTLAGGNTTRRKCIIFNDAQQATLFLKFGKGASMTDFTYRIAPQSFWDVTDYSGILTGVWDAAEGAAQVTECVAG